jgi:hypothetical protein
MRRSVEGFFHFDWSLGAAASAGGTSPAATGNRSTAPPSAGPIRSMVTPSLVAASIVACSAAQARPAGLPAPTRFSAAAISRGMRSRASEVKLVGRHPIGTPGMLPSGDAERRRCRRARLRARRREGRGGAFGKPEASVGDAQQDPGEPALPEIRTRRLRRARFGGTIWLPSAARMKGMGTPARRGRRGMHAVQVVKVLPAPMVIWTSARGSARASGRSVPRSPRSGIDEDHR